MQESDEITLISSAGIVLRMKAANVSIQGRATQGVKVMVLDEGDSLAAVARIPAETANPAVDADLVVDANPDLEANPSGDADQPASQDDQPEISARVKTGG